MFTRIRHAHHLKTIFGLSSDYNSLNGRSRRTNISLTWNFTNFISRKWQWDTVKQERLVSIALYIPCELCRLYSTSLSSVLFVYSASRVRVSVSQIVLIVVKAILLFALFKIDRSNNNKKMEHQWCNEKIVLSNNQISLAVKLLHAVLEEGSCGS